MLVSLLWLQRTQQVLLIWFMKLLTASMRAKSLLGFFQMKGLILKLLKWEAIARKGIEVKLNKT